MMKKLFSFALVLVLGMATQGFATTVNYTADNTSIFPNPERGFITMLDDHLTTSDPYGVKGHESQLDAHANNDKGSLILVHYYLDNFKNTATLPSAILDGFDEDMAVLRSKGMKAIIRFSYADHDENETAIDAPFSIVQQHINQYASHWQDNADVIFCFQAGIVGAWGEWYYTSNYGNKVDYMNTSRKQVVDALLAAVPADRCIQLRTPKFKTSYLNSTAPLTAAEAHRNTAKARLGHHNDAFLYHADNMGTYEDTATQKPYIAQETLYVPIGGESDITSSSQAQTEASYDATIAEMSRLHWTFIQSGYSTVVTNMWRNNGTFDELNRRMGYRYQLVTATFPASANAGGQAAINMQIKNVGFAPLYNERHAYIVLKSGNNSYSIQLQSDPRSWLPNGVVTTINEQITIPSNVPAGTYQLYLYMPDAYASIANNPKYAVRFANKNVWDANTGMNNLNASITIQGGTDPTPVDPPTPVTSNITIDGNFSDWTALTDAAQAELPSGASLTGLYKMSWYANESDIFYYIEYDAQSAYIGIMMNTDGNSTTGHASWMWTNAAAEYIIQDAPDSFNDASLFAFGSSDQSDWSWNDTGVENFLTASNVVTLSNGHKAFEGKISQAALPTSITELHVGVFSSNAGWAENGILPRGNGDAAAAMLEVPIHKATTALDETKTVFNNQAYDILGRPVNADYRGVVIINGKKILRLQ